jgi:excisionase family DNA binding protein
MREKYIYPQIGIVSLEEILSQSQNLNEQKRKLELQLASLNEEIFTFVQASNFLSISESTLHRKIAKGEIKRIQSGKGCKITFRKSQLLEYLERNTRGRYSKEANSQLGLNAILKK